MRWLAVILLISSLALSIYYYRRHKSANKNVAVEQILGKKSKIQSGEYFVIRDTPFLNPSENNDFAVLFWFKVNSKISNKEKVQIAEKYDASAEKKPGWALRISNNKKIYRPEVYWVNPSGKGRWYSFTDFPFATNRWFGMLLSFKEGKYLGLKLFRSDKNKKLETVNLGGYSLPGIYPKTQAELKAGSVGGKLFSGAFGRVYYGPGLLQKDWLERIFKQCQGSDSDFCQVD